jgi:hypothetical protein
MIIHCKYDIVFVQFLLCFLYVFIYNKACNWSIGFLQIVNISKLYHILGSNHSTFYVWSFQVSFLYKFLVLKMQTLLLTKYMWKTITFHCLPSSRCRCNEDSFRVEKQGSMWHSGNTRDNATWNNSKLKCKGKLSFHKKNHHNFLLTVPFCMNESFLCSSWF